MMKFAIVTWAAAIVVLVMAYSAPDERFLPARLGFLRAWNSVENSAPGYR